MKNALRLVVPVLVTCIVAAAGLAVTYTVTEPKIAEQDRLAEERSLQAVLPDATFTCLESSRIQDDIDAAADPPAVIAAEREIFAKQVQGKPANIIEKIVDGKMNKFYEQVCLLEQPFVRDQEQKVGQLLQQKNKEIDDTIVLRRFARFQVGEALE